MRAMHLIIAAAAAPLLLAACGEPRQAQNDTVVGAAEAPYVEPAPDPYAPTDRTAAPAPLPEETTTDGTPTTPP